MGKLSFTLEEYKDSAIKYRAELVKLPLLSLAETLKYMTLRPGITNAERVGNLALDVELAPYKPKMVTAGDLNLIIRELKVYMGALNYEFDPNSAIGTLLGHRLADAKGERLKNTVTAREVLGLIAKNVGQSLDSALFGAVRNADGNKTMDLFDGFDTITETEITAGKISAANKNYLELPEKITSANAVDLIKEIEYSLDTRLRHQKAFFFVPQEVADAYNDAYLLSHSAVPYNTQFSQHVVEGSAGLHTIVPLPSKDGSDFIHVATKEEMLVGCDTMSDIEQVDVANYSAFVISFLMTMVFGVQFETLHPSRFTAVKLA